MSLDGDEIKITKIQLVANSKKPALKQPSLTRLADPE
jgi:hypothetical protein